MLTKVHITHYLELIYSFLMYICHLTGDSHALHASRLSGESPEVHRQGSYATRETKK